MSSLKQDQSYVDIPKHSSKELQPFKFETCICMSIQKRGWHLNGYGFLLIYWNSRYCRFWSSNLQGSCEVEVLLTGWKWNWVVHTFKSSAHNET